MEKILQKEGLTIWGKFWGRVVPGEKVLEGGCVSCPVSPTSVMGLEGHCVWKYWVGTSVSSRFPEEDVSTSTRYTGSMKPVSTNLFPSEDWIQLSVLRPVPGYSNGLHFLDESFLATSTGLATLGERTFGDVFCVSRPQEGPRPHLCGRSSVVSVISDSPLSPGRRGPVFWRNNDLTKT